MSYENVHLLVTDGQPHIVIIVQTQGSCNVYKTSRLVATDQSLIWQTSEEGDHSLSLTELLFCVLFIKKLKFF